MKKLPKFLIATFGTIVMLCLVLSYLGKANRAAQAELVTSMPEKSLSFSREIFGPDFTPIELAKNFDIEQDFLLTEQHLDHPEKLRKFSERFCALEDRTHCYLLFYTDREALPTALNDLSGDAVPRALFTINKASKLKELSYNIAGSGYTDKDYTLQLYFKDHGNTLPRICQGTRV